MSPKFGSTLLCLAMIGLALNLSASLRAAEDEKESGEDTAEGLPPEYTNYLVAQSTMSPDKKFAVIYPTQESLDAELPKNFLVALKPFSVLAKLPSEDPYFQHKSHGGINAVWAKNESVALITLESKWGPGDVFLVELSGGKVKRTTNLLKKLTQIVLPKFRAAMPKAEKFNDNYQFIFEPGEDGADGCVLEGNGTVKIDLVATNDPKFVSEHPWSVRVKAKWDIAQAKFSSQEIKEDKR